MTFVTCLVFNEVLQINVMNKLREVLYIYLASFLVDKLNKKDMIKIDKNTTLMHIAVHFF